VLHSGGLRRLRSKPCIEDGVVWLGASRKNGCVSRRRMAKDFALASQGLHRVCMDREAPPALSRQIVSLFSPDTLVLVSIPGSAATAGAAPAVDGDLEAFRDQTMARRHQVTINGNSFLARRGELLLDAALSNGIDLPYNCRAGHCGTCCVRLVSGKVRGGEGSEQGIVHACQCRIVGDAVLERDEASGVRTVDGVLSSLRALSPEVMASTAIRADLSASLIPCTAIPTAASCGSMSGA